LSKLETVNVRTQLLAYVLNGLYRSAAYVQAGFNNNVKLWIYTLESKIQVSAR